MNKLRIGWFSFSCCEDNTIIFTELLNDHWMEWKDIMEFAHARVLKANNEMKDLDISFVEGAIAGTHQREKLLEIRENSKKVIAVGSCACTGIPSGQRNQFDEDTKRAIQHLLDRYGYEKEVLPINKVVEIDDQIPDCPMSEENFLKVLNNAVADFLNLLPAPRTRHQHKQLKQDRRTHRPGSGCYRRKSRKS